MLLSSLPDEFEHLETTLLHGKENVSLDVVCSALYGHELRKQDKMKTKSTTSKEALCQEVISKAILRGEEEGPNQKVEALPKMSVLFVMRKGTGRKTVRS